LDAEAALRGRRLLGVTSLRRALRRLSQWTGLVRLYWRESRGFGDFVALMRVRLSQSKIGRWVTPRPIVVDVDLVSLGRRVRLRSHTTDISVLSEITDGDSLGRLPPGLRASTIVDLGANIGLSYRWFRARYPDARFVCVEPDRGNLEILSANVRSDGGRCDVVGACVGGHPRRVRLDGGDGEWGFRLSDVDDPGEADTDVVTMDQLLSDAGFDRVDVLKCDIEGAEGELFAHCRSWIDRVESMIVECHTDVMSTEGLIDALARNGAHFEVLHVLREPGFGYEMATLRRSAPQPEPAALSA
jgi:FkbM family methyltransferase